jgi:large subunit ribosomal protein L18
MEKVKEKRLSRLRRHRRVRKKIFGTPSRPRLAVYKSNAGMIAQIINDTVGKTLVYASTSDKELKGKLKHPGNAEAAALVGQLLAQRAVKAGIKDVVFDRGGFLYHGRVKALADAARKEGLNF